MSDRTIFRKILAIDPYGIKMPKKEFLQFGNIRCEINTFFIELDLKLIERLIFSHRNSVDAIVLQSIPSGLSDGNNRLNFAYFEKFKAAAGGIPIFTGELLRDVYARWTLEKAIKHQPQFFWNKSILFHIYSALPLKKVFQSLNVKFSYLDPLVLHTLPVKITSEPNYNIFFRSLAPLTGKLKETFLDPTSSAKSILLNKFLRKFIKNIDIFITFSRLIEEIDDYSVFDGKLIIIDGLSGEQRAKMELAKPYGVIEYLPEKAELESLGITSFSTLVALIYLEKSLEHSHQSLDEYLMHWISKYNLIPDGRIRFSSCKKVSFIIHPLHQSHIWNAKHLRMFKKSPKFVKDTVEKIVAHSPAMPFGKITGIKSIHNGQEVSVDLYALPATPRQLLEMDEETAYRTLVRAVDHSAKNQSLLAGLGAYTKVIGDAGVSVNRRATIPVTTGNSYSTASTLWAAAEMVSELGFVKIPKKGGLLNGKAMVIGASGSIGRVCSLIVSESFKEVFLVAPRLEKLLELKEEIREISPATTVTISQKTGSFLGDVDLIITATSNQSGDVLDIEKVKPGAVICDCSRPLDISADAAAKRPDVLIIESGEIDLPGNVKIEGDIGLPKPSVYACLAETVLLALEGRYEPFSLSRELSLDKVKEIYEIGLKHGAKLSAIQTHSGVVTDELIQKTRRLALAKRREKKVKLE